MFRLRTLGLLSALLLAVAGGSWAQDGSRLPDAPKAKGLPDAPKLKEAKGLPDAPKMRDAGALPDAPKTTEGAVLPDAPKLTRKYPGNDLTGIGAVDPRTTVDQTEMPWRAIGRLKAGGGSCTASLVAPAVIMTAAHCVFGGLRKNAINPGDLHFYLAYSSGKFEAEATGVRVITADDYDPILAIGSMGKDWALVELDKPIGLPDRILTLRKQTPQPGDDIALGGYAADNIETFLVDLHCSVLGLMSDKSGMPLVRHSCTATHGVSGAPLMVRESGGGWTVGGIEVVGSAQSGGASVLVEVKEALDKIVKK